MIAYGSVSKNREAQDNTTYRNKDLVLGGTIFLEPFTEAANGDACGLPDASVAVTETGFYDRPHFVHERSHELAAAFNSNAKSEHRPAALSRLLRRKVLDDQRAQGGEDLHRRKVGGQSINNAKCRLFTLSNSHS